MKKSNESLVDLWDTIKRMNMCIMRVPERGAQEKGAEILFTQTRVHYRWDCKLVQPLLKTVWRFLKILKIKLPYNTAILLWVFVQNNRKH